MEIVTVQTNLRILASVMRRMRMLDSSDICDLAADAMDDQAATITRLAAELDEAMAAIRDIYMAGHWSLDRPVADQEKFWDRLGDVAGIDPGDAPKPLTRGD